MTTSRRFDFIGAGFARIVAVLAITTLPAAAQIADRETEFSRTLTIETSDGPRRAIVVGARATPRPVLMALHGGGGSAERLMQSSGFTQAAIARGMVAVYPDGTSGHWNDGRGMSPSNDVEFLTKLAAELVRLRIAEPGRVGVTGVSNGGMMAYRLACEAAGRFTGFAAIIANMPVELGSTCRPARPVPMLVMNGTADPLVPYEGGAGGFFGRRGEVWSTQRTIDFFARVNRCGVPRSYALPDRDPSDGSTVMRITWQTCAEPTVLYRVDGGGHQIPGATTASRLTGPANQDISGVRVVAEFLSDLR